MTQRRRSLHALAATALSAASMLALASGPALGQVDVGVRGGYYTDAEEPFLGLGILTQISDTRWYFNPNVEFVFVDPGDLWTLNLDAHYDFRTADADTYVWAGGGPALVFRDFERRRGDDSETDFGINLLAGVGWQLEQVVPYIQGKILLSDDSEAVLGFGVRF